MHRMTNCTYTYLVCIVLFLLNSTPIFSTTKISCDDFIEREYDAALALELKEALENMSFEEMILSDNKIKTLYCLSQKPNDPELKAAAIRFIGGKYFEASLFKEAKEIFTSMINDESLQKAPNQLAYGYNYLSLIASMENKTLVAYKHDIKLLEICREHNSQLLPKVYLNLGQFHFTTKEYDQAEEFYLLGMEAAESVNIPPVECGWLLHRLGELYRVQNKTKDALFFLKKASTYWQKVKNKRGEGFTNIQLANVYSDIGQKEKARQILKETNEMSLKNEYWLCLLEGLYIRGKVDFAEKKYKSAIKYIQQSDSLKTERSLPFFFKDGYKILAESFAATNQPLKANENYKNYLIEVKDNLDNENAITKEWVKKNKDLLNNRKNLKILEQEREFDHKRMALQTKLIIASFFLLICISLLAASYFQANKKSIRHQEKLMLLNSTIKEQSNQLQIAKVRISKEITNTK